MNNSIVIDFFYFFYFSYIKIATGCKKDITSKEKQDIEKLLEIVKKMKRDHRTIKKDIEKIVKMRARKNWI